MSGRVKRDYFPLFKLEKNWSTKWSKRQVMVKWWVSLNPWMIIMLDEFLVNIKAKLEKLGKIQRDRLFSCGGHSPSPRELVNNILWSLFKQKQIGWPSAKDGIGGNPSVGARLKQDPLLFSDFLLITGIVQFRFYKLILVRSGLLV